MSTTEQQATHVRDLRGLSRGEALDIAQIQYDKLIATLRELTEEEWNAPTDCERWRVRDIVAHLSGWAEAFAKPTQFAHLLRAGRRMKKELGNTLDAQNEAQVEERKHLSTDELLARYERAIPRFMQRRRVMGGAGHYLPIYSGATGPSNLGFLMNIIFTRDTFMHRIDIGRGIGKEPDLGEPERKLVADVVRHWVRNSKAVARLILTGPAGGTYLTADNPAATITGDAIEFCRLLAGRADPSVMTVEGDERAAARWLAVPVLF